MKRENFNSRIGFILVSAGCAIGIGNVWKFPYLAGQNGGGYFVLFYLLFLIIMGIPVMTMELAVGRASRKSAVLGYKALEPTGSKWHWHGWACVIGCLLLMMYYTTVSGWMLAYFFKFVSGAFTTVTVETSDSVFANMLGNPVEMGIFMAITVAGGLLVCSGGVQKGLEKVTKIMMVCLLALIVVLAVHSLTLSGAAKGIDFYLRPNMNTIRSVGIFNVITNAMNQAFFTLSLGIALAKLDKRVLLVDTDPQGDLTKSLGWSNPDSLEITVANHIQAVIDGIDLQAREGILSHKEGIDLMPANIDLASMEMGIFMAMSREQILNTWLSCIKDSYDYVLIDCAPTLGILPVNAFVASDSVLIPVSAEFLPASAMTELLKTINRVKRQINPSLDVEGILITLFDTRNNLAREVEQTIRNQYGNAYRVFDSIIPRAVSAAETPAVGVSIFAYDKRGKVATAFTSLADEVVCNG